MGLGSGSGSDPNPNPYPNPNPKPKPNPNPNPNQRIPALRLLGLSAAEAVALRDQLLLVRVGEWEPTARCPVGELEGSLGRVGDLDAESKAILLTHQP